MKRWAMNVGLLAVVLSALVGCKADRPSKSAYSAVDPAEEEFAKASNRPPTVKTQYALARLLVSKDNDPAAERVLSRLIAQNPQFLPAYVDLAALHLRHDRVAQAKATLESAAKVAPQDPVVANNLGMCALLEGRTQDALAWFERAHAAAPADGRFAANRAMALALLGRDRESLEAYKKVLPVDEAERNLETLRRSRQPQGKQAQAGF